MTSSMTLSIFLIVFLFFKSITPIYSLNIKSPRILMTLRQIAIHPIITLLEKKCYKNGVLLRPYIVTLALLETQGLSLSTKSLCQISHKYYTALQIHVNIRPYALKITPDYCKSSFYSLQEVKISGRKVFRIKEDL